MVLLFFIIAVPAAEVFAFIEVGEAIGWLAAVVLLLGTSVVGTQLLRIQGRAAMGRVALAVSERRAPGVSALDGALGILGAALLTLPGFLTDGLGVLLLFYPTRALTRRWLSRHYAGRIVSFANTAGRFTSRGRTAPPADVDSTAVEDDIDRLSP